MEQRRIRPSPALLLAVCTLLAGAVDAFSLASAPIPLPSLSRHALRTGHRRPSTTSISSTSEPASSPPPLPFVVPERGLHKTALGYMHYLDYQAPGAAASSLPVVCLHMMPASAGEFAKAAAILSVTHNRRVVAVDLLGYGASDCPTSSCSVLEQADAVVSVCDSLGIDRFSLAGSLTGSKMATAIASRHPQRVGALAVTHIYEKQPSSGARAEVSALKNFFQERWLLAEDGSHLIDVWGIRQGRVSPEDNQRKTTEHLIAKMNQNSMHDLNIVMQPAHELALKSIVGQVTCPVLCVTGSGAAAFYDSMGLGGANLAFAVSQMPAHREELVVDGADTFVLATHPAEWAAATHDFFCRAEAGGG